MSDLAEVGTAAALLLAAALAWAGAAKLVAVPAVTEQFRGLGVPNPRLAARVVPIIELGVAAGLIITPRPAAIAALVMLGAFTALLARALARGVETGCGCFGARRADPVSTVDLVRNGWLAGAGALALATSRVEVPTLAASMTMTLGALVALVVLALLRLKRDVGAVWAMPLAGEMVADR